MRQEVEVQKDTERQEAEEKEKLDVKKKVIKFSRGKGKGGSWKEEEWGVC